MSRVIRRGYSFGLEKSRYLELRYFCLQYNLKKQAISRMGVKQKDRYEGDKGDKGGGSYECKGKLQLEKFRNDIKIIDKAIELGAGDIGEYMLRSITEDIGYNFLGVVPCGERQFYEYKRAFFKELDKLK